MKRKSLPKPRKTGAPPVVSSCSKCGTHHVSAYAAKTHACAPVRRPALVEG